MARTRAGVGVQRLDEASIRTRMGIHAVEERVSVAVRAVVVLAALEVVVFLYPPWVEATIPNYYIHYEVWIPLAVLLHVAWAVWLRRRWRRIRRVPRDPASSVPAKV